MRIRSLLRKPAQTWHRHASTRFRIEETDPERLTMNQFWRQASSVARPVGKVDASALAFCCAAAELSGADFSS
jgi:hypothetical protein